jgi:hypothetical protein
VCGVVCVVWVVLVAVEGRYRQQQMKREKYGWVVYENNMEGSLATATY